MARLHLYFDRNIRVLFTIGRVRFVEYLLYTFSLCTDLVAQEDPVVCLV
jgi:hypothetical protein